ncbi:hypothetical protein HPP92_003585 [Vanilla planifolia]|uniref:Bifunctional inhibitor/plant lipid transfer protein/seed storage helical domain-containing protein n=1 Tax=Vanilla planifolia TaxID=51239 RepID=A0A835VFL3_VANPL|nr:hypothetical protein HPP92_003585 [Vanilla planifolia]
MASTALASNIPYVLLLLFSLATQAYLLPLGGPSPADVGDACGGLFSNLLAECESYVLKNGPKAVNPSPVCCAAVKAIDRTCFCSHVTSELLKLVDIHKVVDVARICNKPLSPGKCGNVTIPSSTSPQVFAS